ncbi:hypothetical protein CEXT_694351 [Caerostris extrusa]|uniref:Uncharacterized protein n=1 Tax=Caerostris extrusa TaxID=172846 RepID=A0AAV4Y3R5_CAEEX|nr:hypothetical protein CEXT_694351 [Caerostris extrusa]
MNGLVRIKRNEGLSVVDGCWISTLTNISDPNNSIPSGADEDGIYTVTDVGICPASDDDDGVSTVTDVRSTDSIISSGTVGGTLDGTNSIDIDDSIFLVVMVVLVLLLMLEFQMVIIFSGIAGSSLNGSVSTVTDVRIPDNNISSGTDCSTLVGGISTVTDVRAADCSISSGTILGTSDGTDSIYTNDSIISSSDGSASVITDNKISDGDIFLVMLAVL